MPYEAKMSVAYEDTDKTVTVHFRGEKIVLPGPYQTREQGMEAGEQYCRERGWQG